MLSVVYSLSNYRRIATFVESLENILYKHSCVNCPIVSPCMTSILSITTYNLLQFNYRVIYLHRYSNIITKCKWPFYKLSPIWYAANLLHLSRKCTGKLSLVVWMGINFIDYLLISH